MRPDQVVVVGSTPPGGHFRPREETSSVGDVLQSFDELERSGRGYLEVRLPEQHFPVLIVGVGGEHAVIQCLFTPERMALFRGGGSVAPHDLVEVLVMDDMVPFAGEFALSMGTARMVLKAFAESEELASLGSWSDL